MLSRLKNKLKSLRPQPPLRNFTARVRYWHTATVTSFSGKVQATFAWSNEKKRDYFVALMSEAISKPTVTKGKIQRERADGWLEVI